MSNDGELSCPFKRAKINESDNIHSLDDNQFIEERLREFDVLDEVPEDISGSENDEGINFIEFQ